MNKTELIEQIAIRANLTKADANRAGYHHCNRE